MLVLHSCSKFSYSACSTKYCTIYIWVQWCYKFKNTRYTSVFSSVISNIKCLFATICLPPPWKIMERAKLNYTILQSYKMSVCASILVAKTLVSFFLVLLISRVWHFALVCLEPLSPSILSHSLTVRCHLLILLFIERLSRRGEGTVRCTRLSFPSRLPLHNLACTNCNYAHKGARASLCTGKRSRCISLRAPVF